MSEPRRYSNWRDGALQEVISAMSALQMPAEALENPQSLYLCDTDRWAKHALEHLEQAVSLLVFKDMADYNRARLRRVET